MKDIKVVIENLSSQGISLDHAQTLFLKEFIDLDSIYKPRHFFLVKTLSAIYIFGVPVGRGKTMLLQGICNSYFPDAGQFHFHRIHASCT